MTSTGKDHDWPDPTIPHRPAIRDGRWRKCDLCGHPFGDEVHMPPFPEDEEIIK